MGTLTYQNTEEGTPVVIVAEDSIAVEETPAPVEVERAESEE